MTDQQTALRELPAKGSDATVLREMIDFTAQWMMELETEGRPAQLTAGAAPIGECSATATARKIGRPGRPR